MRKQQFETFFELSKNGDVEWILGLKPQVGQDSEEYNGYFVYPKKYELEFESPDKAWRFEAFRNFGVQRSAVIIAINFQHFLAGRNPAEELGKVVEELRVFFLEAHLLHRKAFPAEIAKSIACVGNILNQEISEQAAMFIISLFTEAGVPPLLLNHICWHVAAHETGRLKPATFQVLIERSMDRYNQIRMGLSTYGEVFENFDEALKFALEKEPSLLLPKEMLEF